MVQCREECSEHSSVMLGYEAGRQEEQHLGTSSVLSSVYTLNSNVQYLDREDRWFES